MYFTSNLPLVEIYGDAQKWKKNEHNFLSLIWLAQVKVLGLSSKTGLGVSLWVYLGNVFLKKVSSKQEQKKK